MSIMKECDCDETTGTSGQQPLSEADLSVGTKPAINVKLNIKELKDKKTNTIVREWTAFMAHINHTDAEELRQDLERLETKYIMGLEVSSYEHIHFLAKMTTKEYAAFSKKNFIDKRKLRGRATKGLPRQYGKEKEIRDLEKYAKYCLKDQKYLTNMDKHEIEEIIKMKIDEVKNTKSKNANSVDIKNELIQYCNENMGHRPSNSILQTESWNHYHRLLKIKIVDFMRLKELSIRKSTIDMYFYHVLAYSEGQLKMSSADIIDSLYTTQLM